MSMQPVLIVPQLDSITMAKSIIPIQLQDPMYSVVARTLYSVLIKERGVLIPYRGVPLEYKYTHIIIMYTNMYKIILIYK